jgi:hypothetical protein
MYAYIYAYRYVYFVVYMHARHILCVCVCMYVCEIANSLCSIRTRQVCECMCMYTCVCKHLIPITSVNVCACTHSYVHPCGLYQTVTFTQSRTYISMYVCMYVCMYVYTYVQRSPT